MLDEDAITHIESWPSTTLAEADGLDDLPPEFNGVVTAGNIWLFVVNGSIVGRVGGDRDDVQERRATAYDASEPTQPLLFAMQEAEGQTEAEYYTGNTPVSEADEELAGDFVGYIELSEDVLSGDYYAVYDGDTSMYVGFLGGGEVVTGDEALDKADNEVGVYEIVSVELDVEEISIDATEEDDEAAEQESEEVEGEDDDEDDTGIEPRSREDYEWELDAEDDELDGEHDSERDTDDSFFEDEDGGSASATNSQTEQGKGVAATPDSTDAPVQSMERDEADFDELKSEHDDDDSELELPESVAEEMASPPDSTVPQEEITTLQQQMKRLAGEIASNGTDVERLQQQVADLAEKAETVMRRQRDLEERVEEFQAEAPVSESESSETKSVEQTLERGEALDKLDVFLRYESRADPTIEDAAASEASQEEANENIKFEVHSQFDADETDIEGGKTPEEFLEETIEHRFVEHAATELLYEIMETNNKQGLQSLYDSIQQINRAEFNGSVEVGEESVKFDLVIRDQRGRPLIVGDAENGNQPVKRDQIESLIDKANSVSGEYGQLGAAVFLTTSFYESGALESADKATKDGFISRRQSVVKDSGNNYQLCLLEGREDSFHMTMPEL